MYSTSSCPQIIDGNSDTLPPLRSHCPTSPRTLGRYGQATSGPPGQMFMCRGKPVSVDFSRTGTGDYREKANNTPLPAHINDYVGETSKVQGPRGGQRPCAQRSTCNKGTGSESRQVDKFIAAGILEEGLAESDSP
ncbi:hypothetical protein IF2G_04164 [Cordyceps javanica]|nr:hypothetical protein IF2G_04164 [Cordyceps javanica]